jgi:catechol 2,3-dioxygenase-like lactoylglutathione lyase family enzyme
MKRLHVHVAVTNLADSIRFYTQLFAAEPSVVKADYAKWMLEDPRVNFAISQRSLTPGLNHLGVQVESAEELAEMHARLQQVQPDFKTELDKACCYARSDKYWVNDPQGIAWETFHTLESIPLFGAADNAVTDSAECCTPLASNGRQENAPCCIPKQANRSAACC